MNQPRLDKTYTMAELAQLSYATRKDFIRSSSSPPLVSYCLTNYNRSILGGREYLPSLVKNLVEDSPAHAELVITDWYSTDLPLRNWLPDAWTKDLQIIDMEGKFSLALGKEIACERSNGQYIFVLDADMLVPKGYTQTILTQLRKGWASAFPIYFDEREDGSIWPTPELLNESTRNQDLWTGEVSQKEALAALMPDGKQVDVDSTGGFGCYAFRQSSWPLMRGGFGRTADKTSWGSEDHEIYNRARSLGPIWRNWIEGFISQWHIKEGAFYDLDAPIIK